MIKQAVILSAGFGARLRPLTDSIPKVMIPINGKPLLEWNIEQFKKYGVREFFINLHHLPEVIRSYFGDGSAFGVKIIYSFEPEILGTAGGLKRFKKLLNEHFFFMYGDIFSLVDYGRFYSAFLAKKDAIGMQRVQKNPSNYWDVDLAELDEDGLFLKIHPKPHEKEVSDLYSLRGVFVFDRRVTSYIPENTYYEIGKNVLPDVVESGEKFYGYECSEYSKGIDTKEAYDQVVRHLKESGTIDIPSQ